MTLKQLLQVKKISTSEDVEVIKQMVHTTLIRDQNGLGFSIAGGKGCPAFKESHPEVSIHFVLFHYIAATHFQGM